MSSRRLIPLAAALVLALALAAVARGTTGATIGFPAPRFKVPLSLSEQFEGRFVMTAIGSGANVRNGEMKIEISGVDREGTQEGPYFPVAGFEISEYNSNGEPETALFSVYPFRQVPGGISGTVLTQGLRFNPVGQLTLLKPEGGRELRGELTLHERGPYPVTFRRLYEEELVSEGHAPPAKQLREVSTESAASGWGPTPADYEGRYEITNTAPDASAEAALLAPVIRATLGIGLTGAPVSGGSLTVSGGGEPSAELTVESEGDTVTYFLTDLTWNGDARAAKVRSESTTGKVVGEFEGRQAGGELKGTLDSGGSRYDLSFAKAGG